MQTKNYLKELIKFNNVVAANKEIFSFAETLFNVCFFPENRLK